MSKHEVALSIVLPGDGEACDRCVDRLLKAVRAAPGVRKAHVERSTRPKLCMHYSPKELSLQDLERLLERAGSELDTHYAHFSVVLSGVRHERQAQLVESLVARQPGVYHASVSLASSRLYVEFSPMTNERGWILHALSEAGVAVADGVAAHALPETSSGSRASLFGARSELGFALSCGLSTMISWAATTVDGLHTVALAFAAMAYAFGSWFTLRELVVAWRARRIQFDLLMLLAAAGAAAVGEWVEGALVLFLFTLGRALEGFAMRSARAAISSLASLLPEKALRVDSNGVLNEVPVSALREGDRLIVKPNTQIPVDGFVAGGTSSVNQAPLTGESTALDKIPVPDMKSASRAAQKLPAVHRVFAGSVNGPRALTIVATKRSSDSTVSRMLKTLTTAETKKSPTQQFADRVERTLVPAVLLIVSALMLAWTIVDEPFARSFYRAMVVLVAACPWALATATPSAVLAGIARAMRSGVLIKGGKGLEYLGTAHVIVFDTTGALTEGRPKLTEVRTLDGVSEIELLGEAVVVAKKSDHPLAALIVSEAIRRRSELARVSACKQAYTTAGLGVLGFRGSLAIVIGTPRQFSNAGVSLETVQPLIDELQNLGCTVMVVRAGERFLGALGIKDPPRSNAWFVVNRLNAMGVRRIALLTEDSQQVADAIAKSVGINEALGDLLPQQKAAAVDHLAPSAKTIVVIGDGSDASAMARATVSVAIGAVSSDVALEVADVALMADDLSVLPFAVGLSRAARRVIHQNLGASLGVVAFLVPATLLDLTGMGIAALLHQVATLLVLANAQRLMFYDDTHDLLVHGDRR